MIFRVQKHDSIAPVIAIESAKIDGREILYFAKGPTLYISDLTLSGITYRQVAFDHSCISGIKAYPCDRVDYVGLNLPCVLVWADRSVAIYTHNKSPTRNSVDFSKLDVFFSKDNELDDLVLDCVLLVKATSSVDALRSRSYFPRHCVDVHLVVSFAHNFVDVFQILSSDLIEESMPVNSLLIGRFRCPDVCVLFSSTIFSSSSLDDLVVASGTAFGKIILWYVNAIHPKLPSSTKILSTLLGHEGVIFRMKWSSDRKLIVSTSDDRSIRLWRRQENEGQSSDEVYKQILELWGHSNRPWDVIFYQIGGEDCLISCSEDCTIKIWNISMSINNDTFGDCLVTLRGHEGSIWRIVKCTDSNQIASGGNDGAVKLWSIPFHLQSSAHKSDSSQRLLEFPLISCVDEPCESMVTLPNRDDNGDSYRNSASVIIGKDESEAVKAAIKSRRQNNVSKVFVDPSSNIIVVVLVEGGIWLVDQIAGLSSNNERWHFIINLNLTVTCADVLFPISIFDSSAAISIVCGHSSCSASMIKVALVSSINWTAIYSQTWNAFKPRVTNIWILSPDEVNGSSGDAFYMLTASVKGSFRLWEKKSDTIHLIFSGSTGQGEITSSCSLSSSYELSNNESFRYLFVGFSRGSLYSFLVPISGVATESTNTFADPVSYLYRAHGGDPITSILLTGNRCNQTGLLTIGHDGFMNTYDFQRPPIPLTDQQMEALLEFTKPNENSEYKQISNNSSYTRKLSFPLNPLTLISKQSTLPIRSPDFIYIHRKPFSSELSVYIGGFQGSLYIIWDLLHKYQLAMFEAGAWKRPHHCALLFAPSTSSLPRICFVCPIPLGKDQTSISLYDLGIDGAPEMKPALSTNRTLHLTPNGQGKVSYCGSILVTSNDSQRDFVIVGGELGTLKVFSIDQHMGRLQVGSMVQEMDMPSGVTIKAMTLIPRTLHSKSGILIACGGRLIYSIWRYDITNEGNDCIAPSTPRQNIFSHLCSGSIWPRATQDHRLLSVSGILLVDKYLVTFTDSRGKITICSFVDGNSSDINSFSDHSLNVLEELCPTQYPLLSSKVSVITSEAVAVAVAVEVESINKNRSYNYALGVFGDSNGSIFVYILAGSILLNGDCLSSSICLAVLSVHDMGTNALDVTIRPHSSESLMSESDGYLCIPFDESIVGLSVDDSNQIELQIDIDVIILSGGDDQSLAISFGRVIYIPSSKAVVMVMEPSIYRLPGAAGSAMKGVKILPPLNLSAEANDAAVSSSIILAATVGYDQRLSLWSIQQSMHPATIDTIMNTTVDHESSTSPLRRLSLEPLSLQSQSSSWSPFKWLGGAVVNVTDVCSLAAASAVSLNTDGSPQINLMVVGEGLQIFTIQ